MNNYVYILLCSDHTLYTGYTVNLEKRLKTHNEGLGAKYTRARLPVEIAFYQECASKREALQLEYKIKSFSRQKKIQLIMDPSVNKFHSTKEYQAIMHKLKKDSH